MSTRLGRRMWLTLSALVAILLFATVAAEAMLQGTRPPAKLVTTSHIAASGCDESGACKVQRSVRRSSRAAIHACPDVNFNPL